MLCAAPIFGQQRTWRYATTIVEGTKFYLDSDRRLNAAGNPLVWEKMIESDGLQFVSFVEWDCRLKNRRILQTTVDNADRTVEEMIKQSGWVPIVPDSSSALLYRLICLPQPAAAFAEITASEAALHAAPDLRAPVVRTAQRGERFVLVPNTGERAAGGITSSIRERSRITG